MNDRATIRFEPTGRTILVPVGSTLLSAARLAGVEIDAPCGGLGRCGSCRVRVEGAVAPAGHDERELLGGASIAAGVRLACRARIEGDAVVTLPEHAREVRIVTEAQQRPLVVEPAAERGIEEVGAAGVVVDLGTTTIAVLLADLATGETLAVVGDSNDQRAFGADVLSRVAQASTGGGPELQRTAADQLDVLLGAAVKRADIAADRLAEMVVVGNTAMTGLLLGQDVSGLGQAPYAGVTTAPAQVSAESLGIHLPGLDVLVPPGISAFVGSDIVAGMLAVGLADRSASTLFVDLGTNGEIVLAARGELLAASTAAGPALEGASISCGMRAEAGAIERVTLLEEEGLAYGVIGEATPAGICGSGLLDLVAALLDAGVLDATGKLAEAAPGPLGERLTEKDGVRAFAVEATTGVLLTQKDVRAVQLAVAAVRAGIELLLDEAQLTERGIATVLVAGGFGYHLRAESLARLGLIPAAWQDRVAFVGNTALAGGRMYLVNSDARQQARDLAARVRTIDLAAHPGFQGRFLGSLNFPA